MGLNNLNSSWCWYMLINAIEVSFKPHFNFAPINVNNQCTYTQLFVHLIRLYFNIQSPLVLNNHRSYVLWFSVRNVESPSFKYLNSICTGFAICSLGNSNWFVLGQEFNWSAVLNIKTICHARGLWKLARSCKQLHLLCPPDIWNLPGTTRLSGFQK